MVEEPAAPPTCAVPLLRRQSEAAVAATLEAADGVPAVSVSAETREHLALVHIWREENIKISTESH